MSTTDKITFGIALLGLLLSIWNSWRLYKRDKIVVRVIPKIGYPVGPWTDPRPRFCFEIINDSVFQVTIAEVGFHYRGTRQRGALPNPLLLDDGGWPRRLEPHASVAAYSGPVETLGLRLSEISCAYVTIANGKSFRGRSKALAHVVQAGVIPKPHRTISRSGATGMLHVVDFTAIA